MSCVLLHGYQHSEGKMLPSSFKSIVSLTGRWRHKVPTIITHQTTWCCIPVGHTVLQSDLSEQNIEGGTVAYPGISFGGEGGFQQIQLRTEDRENGDVGAVAP